MLQNDTRNEAIAQATYERWGTDGLVHQIGGPRSIQFALKLQF